MKYYTAQLLALASIATALPAPHYGPSTTSTSAVAVPLSTGAPTYNGGSGAPSTGPTYDNTPSSETPSSETGDDYPE